MSITRGLEKWQIPISKILGIVHDTGANIVKLLRGTLLSSVACFIHSLQLVILEAIKNIPSVTETLASVRRVVTHFGYTKLNALELYILPIRASARAKASYFSFFSRVKYPDFYQSIHPPVKDHTTTA